MFVPFLFLKFRQFDASLAKTQVRRRTLAVKGLVQDKPHKILEPTSHLVFLSFARIPEHLEKHASANKHRGW